MILQTILFSALALSGPAAGMAQQFADSPKATPSAPPSDPAAQMPPGPDDSLRLGPGDLVEVSLYGVPDFKVDVRINSAGEISLPMVGALAVSGLSIEETG